jgi:hypothetical protein
MTEQGGNGADRPEVGTQGASGDEDARDARSQDARGRDVWSQAADTEGAGRGGPGRAGAPGAGQQAAGRNEKWSGRATARTDQDRRQSRARESGPGSDLLSDFQRWLLRSSAKNVRNQITGQVRKTLGSGRSEPGDVWDSATTEIPPEVGESPECQWCPICRAARRIRETNPGLGDHLSTAGDVVGAAVSEALSALDSVRSRASGSGAQAGSRAAEPDDWSGDPAEWAAARDRWAAAHGALSPGRADNGTQPGGDEPERGDGPEGSDEPDHRS